MKIFIAVVLFAAGCFAQVNPAVSKAGSYIYGEALPLALPLVTPGGYAASPGQNVTRRFTYMPPRLAWPSSLPQGGTYIALEEWAQPWIDLSYADRNKSTYRPKFDFNQPNEAFYGHIATALDEAQVAGVTVILTLMQGDDYGGDQWTFNPFNPANNVNSVNAGSYFTLWSNPPTGVRNILKAYAAQMVDRFAGRNIYLEPMNEGLAVSNAWQEELTTYIHSYAASKGKTIAVMRSAFGDVPNPGFPTDHTDPFDSTKTAADAVSIWPGNGPPTQQFPFDCFSDFNTYPSVLGYPVPVFFDTDHNCPGRILTAAQLSILCAKGYSVLQWSIGTPASEASLAATAGHCSAQTPPPPPPSSFVLGVNVSGSAVTIEGNLWRSDAQAKAQGFTDTNAFLANGSSIAWSPGVDAATDAMLDSLAWKPRDQGNVHITQTLPNGTYKVFVWSMENWINGSRAQNVVLQGSQVATNIGDLPFGGWGKYGPYNFTVTDGVMRMDITQGSKGDPVICGFAVFTQ